MSELSDITGTINKKKEAANKEKAATTAARLVLMLLTSQYNSEADVGIYNAIVIGIDKMGAARRVDRLYDQLGLHNEPFNPSVQDLANHDPEACIALCDWFCKAVEAGCAEKNPEFCINGDENIQLRQRVREYHNRDVAEMFAKMNAPKAAELFSQPAVT